jgi:hypothetical protein
MKLRKKHQEAYESEQVSTQKQWLIELLVLSFIVLTTFSSFIFVGGRVSTIDFVVPQSLSHGWQVFTASFYAWSQSTTVGDQATAGTGTLFALLQAVLISYGGVDFASKILFVLPVALSGICMLILGHKRGWSLQARLVTSIIYMVNPYLQSRLLNGHLLLLLAYALLPLVLSAYISATESPTRKSIMKAGLITAFQFILSSNAQSIVMTVGAMLLYSSLQFIISTRRRWSEVLLANSKSFVGTLIISVGLCQFILVPTIWGSLFGSSLQVTSLDIPLDYVAFMSQNSGILDLLKLTGWIGHIFTYSADARGSPLLPPVLDSPLFSGLWLLSTFYVPLLVVFALLKPVRNRLDVFIRALSGIALFLAKGVHRPLGDIYFWLFTSIPLFYMFRENTKFLVLLSFSVAILAGQGVSRIYSIVRPKRRIVSVFLTLFLIFPIIFSNWPAFTGNFQGQIQPFTVPRDMLDTQEFLSQQSGDFRTIWLPLRLGVTEATFFNWTDSSPMVDPAGNPTSFPKPAVGLNMGQFSATDNFIAFFYATLYGNRTSHVGQLLDLLNVRFVILRSDILDENGIIPREWETLHKILLSQEDLVFQRQFGAIYVFENKWASSHISISKSPALIFGDKSDLVFLSDVPGLRLAETPMFFVDDISSETISQIGSMHPTFIWANKRLDDLSMSLLDKGFFLEPSSFAKSSLDVQADWVRSTSNFVGASWLEWNSFLNYPYKLLSDMPPRSLALTEGTNPLRVPFRINMDAECDIWIRTFHGAEEGDLQVVLDGSVDFSLKQRAASDVGFVWSKLGTVRLALGEHYLDLENLDRLSIIDRIAIVPTYQYQEAQMAAIKLLSSPDARNMILLRGIDAEAANQQNALMAPQGSESALGKDALEVVDTGTLRYDFLLLQSGQYSIAILSQSPEPMLLSLCDKTFLISGNTSLRWIKLDAVNLPVGTNHLVVNVTGRAIIDKIVIYSDNEGPSSARDASSPSLFSYNQVDPTSYMFSFASPSDTIVVFKERYNPSWLLYDEKGGAYSPDLVFGFANVYFVRGGNYSLKFEVQKYVFLGFQLSAIVVLVMVVLLVVKTEYWKRLRRVVHV